VRASQNKAHAEPRLVVHLGDCKAFATQPGADVKVRHVTEPHHPRGLPNSHLSPMSATAQRNTIGRALNASIAHMQCPSTKNCPSCIPELCLAMKTTNSKPNSSHPWHLRSLQRSARRHESQSAGSAIATVAALLHGSEVSPHT